LLLLWAALGIRPGKAALPYLYMWETRGNWLTAVEIFLWQVDKKQGLSSSIVRSCEKCLKGDPDSICAIAFPFCHTSSPQL
jgi:hypothetical protein